MIFKINRHFTSARRPAVGVCLVTVLMILASVVPAVAWQDIEVPALEGINPSGIFEAQGEFVMNVGQVHVNITNFGIIGSRPSSNTTMSNAPSCQWPAGSGVEYLWGAGLWVGGVVLGEKLCSAEREWMPIDELEATIYEAIGAKVLRPLGQSQSSGRREPMPSPDDDEDGLIDEEVLDGHDDDFDGLIDEDFGQIGNQMFQVTNYDNTRLSVEQFVDHTPMNLKVVQTSFQWENDQVDDFVGFDFKIQNIGVTDIERVYIGFFADSDIGKRGQGNIAGDDLAGSANTMVAASDGSWVPVSVGYMYDFSETTRVDGYFGIVFLGHDTDPTGERAPVNVGLRTFQAFSGAQSFDQGGDPTNDDERYQLLSAERADWDENIQEGKKDDFRFLVSAGPFLRLGADETLNFQIAMVMGSGLSGLLQNCAEAWLTYEGIYVDKIGVVDPIENGVEPFNPGRLGRETMLCREDFVNPNSTTNPWDFFWPDYMDTTCVDQDWVSTQETIQTLEGQQFLFDDDGTEKTCAMFNMDNCFECARIAGHYCTPDDGAMINVWNCNQPNQESYAGCTGVAGLDTQIHWLVGMAPPPPGVRVWPNDSRVHVFWDDSSENEPDIRLGEIDFESYRVWRADNWDRPFGSSIDNGPESNLWQMIDEYDVINEYIAYREIGQSGVTHYDTIPLGRNTGLESIRYVPKCLSNPVFTSPDPDLATVMQEIVDADVLGLLRVRPTIRNSDGTEIPEYMGLVKWETYPAELDTFFAVTARDTVGGAIAKRATSYYEFVDFSVHNGFLYFYSVTATDHQLLPEDNDHAIPPTFPVGEGLSGDPGSSFVNSTPGTVAQTAEDREKNGVNIYVYPNPATREALEEYQPMFPNGDDPVGARVTFTNLPAAHNTIKIYTVSGDLVETLEHNGTNGSGNIHWNLMSRNLQEVVSGIYLYAVQSDDGAFEDFIGKFVVVR